MGISCFLEKNIRKKIIFWYAKRMISLRNISRSYRQSIPLVRMMSTGGEGSGPGGKSAGSIREAGGKFGEIEQAQEEAFFRKLQQEQLKKIQKTKPKKGDPTKKKKKKKKKKK